MDYRQKAFDEYEQEEQRRWDEWQKEFFEELSESLPDLSPDDLIFVKNEDFRYAQIKGIPELYFYIGWNSILVRSNITDDSDAFSAFYTRSVGSWADIGRYLTYLKEHEFVARIRASEL